MTVHDDGDEARVDQLHAFGDLRRRQFVGFGVDDLDREPLLRPNVAIRPAQTGFSTAVSRVPSDW